MTDVTNTNAGGPAATGGYPPPPAKYTLRLVSVRSFLVVTRRSTSARSGSVDELRGFARDTLIKNLLFGWWGFPFGLVWTPMALIANRNALQKLHRLAASGLAGEGWFPDPSTRHAARYWDGTTWTDRVSDISHDQLPVEAPNAG